VFTARYGPDIYTEFKLISVSEGSVTSLEPQIKMLLMYTKSQGLQCQVCLLARCSSITEQTKQELVKMWLFLTQQPHVR
jgi:hypothetical protein